MNKTKVLMIVAVALLAVQCGCAKKYQKTEHAMKTEITCHTAEGDLRMLEHEKAHVKDQIIQGVTAVTPAGAVVGLVTGTEGTKLRVATGKYNKMIDERIAEIKAHCGIR